MEIVKSPEGNYHIAANKEEWFLIHFFVNELNDNYDEIDEFILNHFDAQDEIAKIAEKINAAHIPDREENYVVINADEMELFCDMMYEALIEFMGKLKKFKNERELRSIFYNVKKKVSDSFYTREGLKHV